MRLLSLVVSLIRGQELYDQFLSDNQEGLLPIDAVCHEPFDIIQTRIVNGRKTNGNWPFIVRLELYPTRARTEFYQCGGSIITNNWIVTGPVRLLIIFSRLSVILTIGNIKITDMQQNT